MKICLYLQRRWAFLGHALAKELKNKYGVEEFCCYSYAKYATTFLRKQEDIKYTAILSEYELHNEAEKVDLDLDYIKKFEKEYGMPNAWQYIGVDRHLMMSVPKTNFSFKPMCSHEQMMKYLQVKSKAITKMFEQEKPDVIVFSAIGSMAGLLMYGIAKKMGIKTINIDVTRLENYMILSDNCFDSFNSAYEIFEEIQTGKKNSDYKEKAVKMIEDFREKEKRYGWMESYMEEKSKKIGKLKFLMLEIGGLIKKTREYYRDSKGDYVISSPFWFAYNKILRLGRMIRGYKHLYDKPNWEEDYAFFPLHLDPEIATLLHAQFHVYQISAIESVAKSLPVHFKLYVKDHPQMIHSRPYWYYKRIKQIPNVKLIDANTSSITIEKSAKLITTITGTVGLEATMLKKPVITFGHTWFNKLSMVKRVNDVYELPKLIDECLKNHKHDEEELINMVSAVLEKSEPVDYKKLWEDMEHESEEMGQLAKLFAKELGLSKK